MAAWRQHASRYQPMRETKCARRRFHDERAWWRWVVAFGFVIGVNLGPGTEGASTRQDTAWALCARASELLWSPSVASNCGAQAGQPGQMRHPTTGHRINTSSGLVGSNRAPPSTHIDSIEPRSFHLFIPQWVLVQTHQVSEANGLLVLSETFDRHVLFLAHSPCVLPLT